MSVSLEKIDMLMERANISYKEAKEALEMHDGDMVEALIYLEASNKTASNKTAQKSNRSGSQRTQSQKNPNNTDFFDDVKNFIQKMHKTNFVIGNSQKKIIDIPLTIASLIILFTLPVSLFVLIIPYLFGYKISIQDQAGQSVNILNLEATEKAKTANRDAEEPEDRLR